MANSIRLPFLLCATLLALTACGGDEAPTAEPVPEGLVRYVHPEASFAWYAPGYLEGKTTQSPTGWRFWMDDQPVEAMAWIGTFDRSLNGRTIGRTELLRNMEIVTDRLVSNRAQLGGSASQILVDTIGRVEGRDRLGYPVVARRYRLTVPDLARSRAGRVLDWAAGIMDSSANAITRGSVAAEFEFVIASAVLRDAFERPLKNDTGNETKAIHSIWVTIPNRITDPVDWEADVVQMPRSLPFATSFAERREVEDRFTLGATTSTLSVLLTIDSDGPILEPEQDQIANQLVSALEAMLQPGVELRIAMARGCEVGFVGAGPGAEPFLRGRVDGFEIFRAALVDRLEEVFQDDPCDGPQYIRSAILTAQQAGTPWQEADERLFLWLAERDDASPSLDNPQEEKEPNEFTDALAAEDADYAAVGPFRETCEAGNRQAPEPAEGLGAYVDFLEGETYEYCESWGESLGAALKLRVSRLVGLELSHTPLPDTLTVFSDGELVPQDPQKGFTYTHASGTLVPGTLLSFGADDRWRAVYEALVEPDVERGLAAPIGRAESGSPSWPRN